jgi:hypothetical protein
MILYCDRSCKRHAVLAALAGCAQLPAIHRKKSFLIFPSLAAMSITKLSLDGNYDVMYKLYLPRESLVSDIPAGGGKIEKLFLLCSVNYSSSWAIEKGSVSQCSEYVVVP